MPTIPVANDLRTNVATWAVPPDLLPAVSRRMLRLLPAEAFDPEFFGQDLDTTYFDTRGLGLRRARRQGERYLTLRLRGYDGETFVLSAKTEAAKVREPVPGDIARRWLVQGIASPAALPLPADLLARLLGLSGDEPLSPVARVRARRYAVEDAQDRLTLDAQIRTDVGLRFPCAILEQKAVDARRSPFAAFDGMGLRPTKLSKFLWATCW